VYSAQVKTNSTTFSFWLLGEKNRTMRSDALFYIFINMKRSVIDYYVVPSGVVTERLRVSTSRSKGTGKGSTWYTLYLDDVKEYQDKWTEAFGRPEA
jgi:hypothetical protein